eukprot:s4421_g3.t1
MVNSFLSMAAASLATKKEEEEKPSGSVKHGVDVKDETQKEEQKQLGIFHSAAKLGNKGLADGPAEIGHRIFARLLLAYFCAEEMIQQVLSFGQEYNLANAHPAQCVVDRFEGTEGGSFRGHVQNWFQKFAEKLGSTDAIFKQVSDVVWA